MIQRRQTLYLLIVVAIFATLFFIDFVTITTIGSSAEAIESTFGVLDYYPLIVLAGLIIAVSATAIFAFKNMALQLRMSVVNLILVIGFIGMEAYHLFPLFDSDIEGVRKVGFASFMPLAALLLAFFAFKGISRDIFRLRSYNRMR